ncbi:hypothetical protein J2T38_000170 [Neisseria perflava]|nr:hypothetical protein [Neisseria perflava]MCP1771378.1 hypothetical protein [Neisseria perflava]
MGSMAVLPNKTDTPLVVNANAVLALPIAAERFKAVAGRDAQEIQTCNGVELLQFAQCNPLNIGKALDPYALKQSLGIFAGKISNHAKIVT